MNRSSPLAQTTIDRHDEALSHYSADRMCQGWDKTCEVDSFEGALELDFESHIEQLLRGLHLLDQKASVMEWCEHSAIRTIEELIPSIGELAIDIGLKPAQAVDIRRRVASAFAAVGGKMAPNFSFAMELAGELQRDEAQDPLCSRMAADVMASVGTSRDDCFFPRLSDKELVDFSVDRADPPERGVADVCGDLAASRHPISQQDGFVQSKQRLPHPRTDKSSVSWDLPDGSSHFSQAWSPEKSRALSSSPLTPHLSRNHKSFEKQGFPEDRYHIVVSPSQGNAERKAKPRTPAMPQWDTSWSDKSMLHSSQQKFFDPIHNKHMYTDMHYRNSSSDVTSSSDWQYTDFGLPDSSSRRSLSVASTNIPSSPAQSSRSLVSSNSSPSLGTRSLSRQRRSSPRLLGNSCNETSARKHELRENVPGSSRKHGSRFGPRGSTGLPWSTAPFYNDRNHPFLGHYYDREGEKAAHRRGKQVRSTLAHRFVPEFQVLG